MCSSFFQLSSGRIKCFQCSRADNMWDIFIKVVAHNLQKLAGLNQIPFWTDGTPSNVWRDAQNFTVSWFTLKILLLKHEPTKYWCPWLYENNFLLHNVYINIDINFDDLQENLKLYILYRLSFYSGRRSKIAISCSEMYLSDDDLWDWPQFRMQEESLSSTSACSSSLSSQHDNETRANLDAMYFLCKSWTPPSCWFIINTRLAEIGLD